MKGIPFKNDMLCYVMVCFFKKVAIFANRNGLLFIYSYKDINSKSKIKKGMTSDYNS
jgi:hypothetical protein